MKRAKRTLAKEPDPGKKKADQVHSDRFFKEVIKNMGDDPGGFDEVDPVEEMRRQLEDLHINQTKIAKAVQKISSKPKTTHQKTSSKLKTKTKSKSKKKKSSSRSKCINAYIISDNSSSESSSSSEESDNEDELKTNALALDNEKVNSESSSDSESEVKYECNVTKKKVTSAGTKVSSKHKKASSSKKSNKTSSAKKSSKDTIKLFKIPKDNIALKDFLVFYNLWLILLLMHNPKKFLLMPII